MFLKQTVFLTLHDKITKAEQETRTLREQNRAMQVTMDWMRVRVTQLEHERAVMLDHFMSIKVQVPEIISAPSPSADDFARQMQAYTQNLFNDVGDERAKALGLQWDDAGEVVAGR